MTWMLALAASAYLQIPGIAPVGPEAPPSQQPPAEQQEQPADGFLPDQYSAEAFGPAVSDLSTLEHRYVTAREFASPVTGERFNAHVLSRSVNFGELDHDGCPHPPINALAYSVVIDPFSGYVAYPEEFGVLSRWTLVELQEILGTPRFTRQTPTGQPWADAYPWEKFENGAKLSIAAKDTNAEIAQWWLQAAWSVRLDLIPGERDFAHELSRVVRGLPTRSSDASRLFTPRHIQIAEHWSQLYDGTGPRVEGDAVTAAPTPGIPRQADIALVIAWLYRSRGELPAAMHWLGRAAESDPAMRSSSLFSYLQNSVRLEREYLARARDALRKGYEAEEIPLARRGGAAFLLGELHRRLDDAEGALFWYDEAQGYSLGAVSPGLLHQQRNMVAAGRLY